MGVIDSGGSFVYPAGDNGPLEVSISTTTQSVPAGTLSAGSDNVMVGIGTPGLANQSSRGITISNTASGSGLWLGLVTPLVPITVN